jgi:hypothetical protein
MGKLWEIRGLFGNEWAMEQTIEMIKGEKGLQYEVLDRRNLSVRLSKREAALEGRVRRAIDIYHGYVEAEGPLVKFDKEKEEARVKRIKKLEAKKGK